MKRSAFSLFALVMVLTLALPAIARADDATLVSGTSAAPDLGFTPEPIFQAPPACHKQDQYIAVAFDVFPSTECPAACADACQQDGGGSYAGTYFYDTRLRACHCRCCPPA